MGRIMYDYFASLLKLSEYLRGMHESEWSPTPLKKELGRLSEDLDAMACRLDDSWIELEHAFNLDEVEIGPDGWPIPVDESRQDRFLGLKLRLRELADFARAEADSLPNSRSKDYLDHAAQIFMHIRIECEMDLPAAYNQDPAIKDFADTCARAGIHLSPERFRGLIATAHKSMDIHYPPPNLARILVLRQ